MPPFPCMHHLGSAWEFAGKAAAPPCRPFLLYELGRRRGSQAKPQPPAPPFACDRSVIEFAGHSRSPPLTAWLSFGSSYWDQVKRIKLIGSSEADHNCQIKSACRVEIKFDGSSLGLFGSNVYARPLDRMPVEKHTCKHPEGCSRLCFLLFWNCSSVYARPFFKAGTFSPLPCLRWRETPTESSCPLHFLRNETN